MKIENSRFPSVGATLQALVAPVVMILLIFAGVTLSLVLTGTLSQDLDEQARSQETAASALRIGTRELRALAADRVRGVANDTDSKSDSIAEWAAEHFGGGMTDAFGAVYPVLFGANGELLYAGDERYVGQGRAFGDLLAATRATDGMPGIASGFIAVDGMIQLAAASTMVPAESAPVQAKGAVLVLLHPLNNALLGQIETDFRLRKLTVSANADIGERSGIFLYDLKGEELGVLSWVSDEPGRQLLGKIATPIIIAALLAGLLLSSFLRTAVRTTRAIRHGEAALAEIDIALEKSESKMQTIIDGVADAILSIDQQGIITSANESARHILGYELDELVGSPAGRYFGYGSPDPGTVGDGTDLPGPLCANPKAPSIEYLELTALRRDGGKIIADVAISQITYYAETVAIAIIRDVTERRRSEETLNLLSTGMILVARDCRILMANRSASRILQQGQGLTMIDERLAAVNRDQARTLRQLIENVCTGVHEAGVPAVMSIERADTSRPLSLMVAPLHFEHQSDESSVAAIFIRDLGVRQSVSAEMLGKLFGLTPAEARVVVELVKGKRPQEVAEDLGVSLNTVRNQLKQIFSKTNTGRQSELISLVLSGTAFLSTQEMGLVADSEAVRLTGS